ncbi:MAG TPA: hypothetical protein VHZ64_14510 [Xanthobacteraceae bacterium]|jgi:hypothetical protein|nr:hypothetical protein [Xanthobacteraceae bacterium]
MDQVTYQTREMAAARDAEELRARGQRLLELATRASCEQSYDFARLLTQLATEVFAHARDLEQAYVSVATPSLSRVPGARRR